MKLSKIIATTVVGLSLFNIQAFGQGVFGHVFDPFGVLPEGRELSTQDLIRAFGKANQVYQKCKKAVCGYAVAKSYECATQVVLCREVVGAVREPIEEYLPWAEYCFDVGTAVGGGFFDAAFCAVSGVDPDVATSEPNELVWKLQTGGVYTCQYFFDIIGAGSNNIPEVMGEPDAPNPLGNIDIYGAYQHNIGQYIRIEPDIEALQELECEPVRPDFSEAYQECLRAFAASCGCGNHTSGTEVCPELENLKPILEALGHQIQQQQKPSQTSMGAGQ